MSTFYIDYEGGNDASDGLSYANRWKTLTSGATAARIAPGDTIRIMASPYPQSTGINATWTNGSRLITLASALTQDIDLCDTLWTAGTNVTVAFPTSRKQGAASMGFTTNGSFTTGTLGYHATGTLNLSAYQQISFWIRTLGPSTTLASGVLQINLCSDTAGATPVNSFTVNFTNINGNQTLLSPLRWYPVTLNYGGALGSSIKSISVVALSTYTSQAFILDNVIACKAPGVDALTLQSLIGKNYASNLETWYSIASITGTTVMLDGDPSLDSTQSATSQGYYGTTETVPLYKRETIKLPHGAATTTATGVSEITDSGTDGSPITYSFGWDRTNMSTIPSGSDGETWVDGLVGSAYGLSIPAVANLWNTVTGMGAVRFLYGIQNSGMFSNISAIGLNNNGTAGFGDSILAYNRGTTFSAYHCNNNGSTALLAGNGIFVSKGDGTYTVGFISGNRSGVNAASAANNSSIKLYVGAITTSGSVGLGLGQSTGVGGCSVYNAIFSNNNSDVSTSGGCPSITYLYNCTTPTSVSISLANFDVWLYEINYDSIDGQYRMRGEGATIIADYIMKHSSSGYAWRTSITSTNRAAGNPAMFALDHGRPVWAAANQTITRSIWVRRDNTGITAKLVCKGGQAPGIPSDVTATASASANTWELLTLTVTPTQSGPIYFHTATYGGTTYNAWYDDTETAPNRQGISTAVVQTGNVYDVEGVSTTGTYDGSDRWTDPGIATVLSGQTYKANSTTNNRTGTLDVAASVWNALSASYTTVGTFGKAIGTNLDATVSSRLPTSSYTSPDNATISAIDTKIGTPAVTVSDDIAAIPTNPLLTNDVRLDNLDATISSRLASGSYTAPDNTTITAINTKLGTPAGASVSSDIASVKSDTVDISDIPTNPVLVTDPRLDYLDEPISDVIGSVWDVPLTSHTSPTTFGGFIQKLLTVAKFLGLK